MFFISGPTALFMLCLAIPVGIAIAICRAYDRRKLRRLIDERNRLFDQGDDEGYRRVQRELTEWTRKLHPRAVKELEGWCAAHPSEYTKEQKRAREEKRRREDEEWRRKQEEWRRRDAEWQRIQAEQRRKDEEWRRSQEYWQSQMEN